MTKDLFKRLRRPQPRREFRQGKRAESEFGPLVVEAGDGAELRVVGGRLVVADGKDA